MAIDIQKTLERMQALTELHGAPGFEDDVKDYMIQQMKPYVDDFVYNRLGGFYGVKRSKKKNAKRVMVAAHMIVSCLIPRSHNFLSIVTQARLGIIVTVV